MKTTILTALLILLAISTVTLADDYRTGTCGQSTTNRCEHIWVDNDGVVTSNRHSNDIADHVMEHELNSAIISTRSHINDLHSLVNSRIDQSIAAAQSMNTLPLDNNSVGVGFGHYRGHDPVTFGISHHMLSIQLKASTTLTEEGTSFGAGVAYEF